MKEIGIAAGHAGFELKGYIRKILRNANCDVADLGNNELNFINDFQDDVIPPAPARRRHVGWQK